MVRHRKVKLSGTQNMHRVAFVYDAKSAYDVKVMTGIASYVRQSTQWNIYIEENALKDQRLPDFHTWKGHGIIADFDHPKVAAAVMKSKLPAVGFGSGYGWYLPKSLIPYFYTNNAAIAAMAAEHLLSRGLRHFAYCGFPPNPINGWSAEREQAFKQTVALKGYDCATYHGYHHTSQRWTAVQRSLGAWLQSLPKPLGLMAANDNRGRHVLEACRTYGLRVPEDIAVIGVDNDELLCSLSSPLMSSVEQGASRLGYQAAELLDKIMKGQKVSPGTHFIIDPQGVVTRRSTEILAIDEPKVAQAMMFITHHYSEGIKAQDVVRAVGVSRSGLEGRFKSIFGYTIKAAILQRQLERARQSISQTNFPLKQIAADVGFPSVQHMTTRFGKAFGQSPAKYREKTAVL